MTVPTLAGTVTQTLKGAAVNPVVAIHLILLGLFAAAAFGLLILAAKLGDRKWARRRELKKLATPYTPPANSRPNDFDERGRPW